MTSDARHDPLRRLFAFLAHLGWQVAPRAQARTLKTAAGEIGWYALSLPDGATLLAVSTTEELTSTAAAFRRFEDFAPVHRRLRTLLRDNALHGRYVLLLSGFRGHLIDLADDDMLLAIETREEWDNRLLPLLDLQAVARGSLSSFPRKSLHQRARELADWTNLWIARIGSSIDTSPAVMARFFDWLHVSRTALRRLPALRTGGESALASRRDLEETFRLLAESHNLLQGTTLKAQLAIAEEAHRSGLLAECLHSYALLSSSKFDAATMAEAFADDSLRLMSWRSSVVAGPTLDNQDEDDPFASALAGYEVNLDTDGTAVLLRRFDDLVQHVTQGALNYELSLQRGQRFGVQLDLLATPIAQPRPQDAVRHVLRHILRVTTSNARRADLVRLIMAARAIEAIAESGHPLRPLPAIAVQMRGTPLETASSQVTKSGLN